jgi:hypothetical protein
MIASADKDGDVMKQPWIAYFARRRSPDKDFTSMMVTRVAHAGPEPASILRWEDDGGPAVEDVYAAADAQPAMAHGSETGGQIDR